MIRKLVLSALAALVLAAPARAQFVYYPAWFKMLPNGSTLTDTGSGVFQFCNSGATNCFTATAGSSGLVTFGGDVGGANWQGQAQIRAGSTSGIFWNSRTDMKAPFDGGIRITLNADTIPTVSVLAACTLAIDGTRSFVSDATSATFGATVAGSGTNHVPVYCDGGNTTWKVG